MSENEQILLLLTSMDKRLKKLCKKFGRKKAKKKYNRDDWAFLEEVLAKFPISRSTLYRWRDDKLVRWDKEGGSPIYYLPDLGRLKNRWMK